MEFIFGFFAGLVWWELTIFIAMGLMCSYSIYENSAIYFLVSIAVIGFFINKLIVIDSIFELIVGFGIYVVIGIFWAIFKYRRQVIKLVVEKRKKDPKISEEDLVSYVQREKSIDEIVFWIIGFPFSMLGFVLYDFIVDIVTKLTRIFDYIAERTIKSIISKVK